MSIKLICSDIDGTLLQYGRKELEGEIFEQIRELHRRGILFCLASGRQYTSLRKLFAPVADCCVFLCENGGVIYKDEQCIAKNPMPRALAEEIANDLWTRSDGQGIERTSLSIITAELEALGLMPPPENAAVVKRVIHTTADFDYARNLRFTPGAVAAGVAALQAGTPIVTDTNMALAGITKPGLARLGSTALCYMADPEVAALAKAAGTTRGPCWPWATPPRPC